MPGGLFLHHGKRSLIRRFKTQRQRGVVPWVVQLVAPVGYKYQFHAQFFRGGVKRAGLIAKLRREQKDSGTVFRRNHSATFIEKIPPASRLLLLLRWGPTGPAWAPLNSTKAHSGTARLSLQQAPANPSLRCIALRPGSRPARASRKSRRGSISIFPLPTQDPVIPRTICPFPERCVPRGKSMSSHRRARPARAHVQSPA